MPKVIPAAATLAKNALDAGKTLVELWRIEVTPGTFRNVINHPRSITYGAVTYQPYPVHRTDTQQGGTGKLAQLNVQVSNVTREVQADIEADAEGLRGKTVEHRIVDADDLTWDILERYIIDSCEADDEWATFVLMKPAPAFGLKFPMLVATRDEFPALAE